MIIVGDVIGERSHLRFGAGKGVNLQIMFVVIFGDIPVNVAAEGAIMFDDPFQGFPSQVQPVELGITFLQPGDDGEGLRIVVKAAIRLH